MTNAMPKLNTKCYIKMQWQNAMPKSQCQKAMTKCNEKMQWKNAMTKCIAKMHCYNAIQICNLNMQWQNCISKMQCQKANDKCNAKKIPNATLKCNFKSQIYKCNCI